MKGRVGFILLYAVGLCFSLPLEDSMEDPAEELEHLLENVSDDNKGCHDVSRYWCLGYSSRCSHPNVYRYCPETCGRCPGSGGWGAWSGFGSCSKSCHYGYQTRSRKCNSPSSSVCQGSSVERRKCNEHVSCQSSKVGPVSALKSGEGTWTAWSSYTPCSKSCGTGTQSRNRTCINPSNPWRCSGPFRQDRPCNQHPCPVDGGWTSWSSFGQCSVSCGGGKQFKYRKCKKPAPQHGGKVCTGPFSMSRDCRIHPCPVDGHWSHWSAFGQCSKTCGGGTQYRKRNCTNPAPTSGGKSCHGPAHQSNACNTQACAVDGQWSQWSVFGSCSQTCGGGFRHRRRTCDSPAPSSGGKQCPGPSFQSVACNFQGCPVNGHWSSWSSFGRCSKSCGGGTQYRSRTCSNPAASGGGKGCSGPSYDSKACNTQGCPANGGWSSWGPFSSCSRTCGTGGRQKRYRTCTNPPPAHGGMVCSGHSSQTRSCWNKVSCPQSGCKDLQTNQFCRYVLMSYRCWQYYGYCRKTCNACNYHRAY